MSLIMYVQTYEPMCVESSPQSIHFWCWWDFLKRSCIGKWNCCVDGEKHFGRLLHCKVPRIRQHNVIYIYFFFFRGPSDRNQHQEMLLGWRWLLLCWSGRRQMHMRSGCDRKTYVYWHLCCKQMDLPLNCSHAVQNPFPRSRLWRWLFGGLRNVQWVEVFV